MDFSQIKGGVPALLIKYGEIALRGGNRKIYEDMLVDAINKKIKAAGAFRVRKDQGRIFAEAESGASEAEARRLWEAAPSVAEIFGLAGVCPCVKSGDNGFENVKAAGVALMKEHEKPGGGTVSFKVEASRADKTYPLSSNEIAAALGEYLLGELPWLKVDVKNPDVRLRVEIRSSLYVYSRTYKGPGGLPAGSGGKGVLLLSGGFDSPVAGYMAAKRGVELVCAYFHSPPYTSEKAREKVAELAQRLSGFAGRVRLYVVPFTETQMYLNEKVPEVKLTLFLKRAMLKAAALIAQKENAQALITGDSIGQVASQTMHALAATDSAAGYPVLRPLCGMDKLDIMGVAEKIGTGPVSARPFADCCTLFVAKHPELKPKRSIIENMEKKLTALEELLQGAVDGAEIVEL